jgi:hypothetical protein
MTLTECKSDLAYLHELISNASLLVQLNICVSIDILLNLHINTYIL